MTPNLPRIQAVVELEAELYERCPHGGELCTKWQCINCRRPIFAAFAEQVRREERERWTEATQAILNLVLSKTKKFTDPYDAVWLTHGGLVDDHPNSELCVLCRLIAAIFTTLRTEASGLLFTLKFP